MRGVCISHLGFDSGKIDLLHRRDRWTAGYHFRQTPTSLATTCVPFDRDHEHAGAAFVRICSGINECPVLFSRDIPIGVRQRRQDIQAVGLPIVQEGIVGPFWSVSPPPPASTPSNRFSPGLSAQHGPGGTLGDTSWRFPGNGAIGFGVVDLRHRLPHQNRAWLHGRYRAWRPLLRPLLPLFLRRRYFFGIAPGEDQYSAIRQCDGGWRTSVYTAYQRGREGRYCFHPAGRNVGTSRLGQLQTRSARREWVLNSIFLSLGHRYGFFLPPLLPRLSCIP